jgi:intracellular sulfur oxidation DsrE/DsrF family protein
MQSIVRSRHALRTALSSFVLAAAAAAMMPAATLVAQSTPVSTADWTAKLKGDHRQLFDSPAPGGGIPLVHIMNYLDTYNAAFKVPDAKINAVGTFYGSTTFHGLNDAMWAKYGISDFLKGVGVEPSKNPAVNPWRTAPEVLGMTLAPASIEALQKRGTTFLLCNNALTIFSGMLAQAKGLDAKTVYEDMRANTIPGVVLVPAMVIAIEQSHKAGIAYHRQ